VGGGEAEAGGGAGDEGDFGLEGEGILHHEVL
jgi:hypothetical protein